MSLKVRKETRIFVPERLVVSTRQEFKEAVNEELEHGAQHIILDFIGMEEIDSTGLGVLVSIQKRMREMERDLELCNLHPKDRELFEVTKLASLFFILD